MLVYKPSVHHSNKDKNKDGRIKHGLGWSSRPLQGQQALACSQEGLFISQS